MNERIKELREQANEKFNCPYNGRYTVFNEELFAELIVKECAGIVQPYMSRWPEDHELTKKIKEHFGVE